MLHILFLILKIIGIILAVILGLLLLAICIVLFVPICYKADLHGSGNARELTVHAKVSWLFGLIKAVFALENGKTDLSVRIAWKKLGIAIRLRIKPRIGLKKSQSRKRKQ